MPNRDPPQELAAALSIRLDLSSAVEPLGVRIGPGKIRLLEMVNQTGSIAAACRALNMSYRRAWLLIDSLNQTFDQPVVSRSVGGAGGGGAELTSLGTEIITRYRRIEQVADRAAADDLRALLKRCRATAKATPD